MIKKYMIPDARSDGDAFYMKKTDAVKAAGLIAKYNHQHKQLNAALEAGNEAGAPQTINREANFIRARNFGAWGGGGRGGFGFGGGFGAGGGGKPTVEVVTPGIVMPEVQSMVESPLPLPAPLVPFAKSSVVVAPIAKRPTFCAVIACTT